MLFSACDSRGGAEPLAGLAARLRALDAEVQVCAPPECPAAEGCEALVATGLLAERVWR